MEEINIKFESSFISDRLPIIMQIVSQSPKYRFWINDGMYIMDRVCEIGLSGEYEKTIYLHKKQGHGWENRGDFSVMRTYCGTIIKDHKYYYFLSSNQEGIDVDANHGGAVLGLISWYRQFITKKTLI